MSWITRSYKVESARFDSWQALAAESSLFGSRSTCRSLFTVIVN